MAEGCDTFLYRCSKAGQLARFRLSRFHMYCPRRLLTSRPHLPPLPSLPLPACRSDLASIFVLLFEDDALAFACFERLMRAARRNFKHDETGIRYTPAREGGLGFK